MKKAMILAALCAAVLAGCGEKYESSGGYASGKAAETPETVARKFLEAMATADLDAARKYMCADTAKDFDASMEEEKKKRGEVEFTKRLEKEKKKAKEKSKGVKIEKKDVKIDGDKATVTFTASKEGEKRKDDEIKLNLVKEDGEWKVDMSAEKKEGSAYAAGSQGRKLYQGILFANMSLQRNGNKTIWPKTKSRTSGGSSKIWNKGYRNSRDYFADLFDVKNAGAPEKQKKEIMEDVNVIFGCGVPAPADASRLGPENIMWCIAGNLQDSYPDVLPVIVSANVDVSRLLARYDGEADDIVPIGRAAGIDSGLEFNDDYAVFIRKNGATEVIPAKKLTLKRIYEGQAFDISNVSGNREPFCYLTPKGKVECSGPKTYFTPKGKVESNGPNAPEAVAQKFLETAMAGDMDAARKYMSKDAVKMLDGLEEMAKKQDEKKYKEEKEKQKKKMQEKAKGVKIEKKNVKVDGDKATVTFKLSKEGEKEAEEEKIELVKEDGEWKVAM